MAVDLLTKWAAQLADASHTSEWISGATGAVAALMGVVLAELFNRYRHRAEKKERFAASAFSAYQRLIHIYSVTMHIRNHLREGHAAAQREQMEICLRTQALNKLSDGESFPNDELWSLTRSCGYKLVNGVSSLDHQFNALIASMEN